MTTSITFALRPHGPFRVSTGSASGDVDASIDDRLPLPATSLKGVARHTAERVLGLPPSLVEEVFGSPATAPAWAWSDLAVDSHSLRKHVRAQVQIDESTGTAAERALLFAEELWVDTDAPAPTFGVHRLQQVDPQRLSDHVAVLVGSACGVHSLGASRRRGLGWVEITVHSMNGRTRDLPDLAEIATRLLQLRDHR